MAKEITNPIEIANWKRSQNERIKVTLECFRGRNLLPFELGGRTKTVKTSQGGTASLDVAHVPKLARAFKRAHKQAKKAGLIDE